MDVAKVVKEITKASVIIDITEAFVISLQEVALMIGGRIIVGGIEI